MSTNQPPIYLSVELLPGDREVALMHALQQVMEYFGPSSPFEGATQPIDNGMRSRASAWMSNRYSSVDPW